MIYRWLLWWSRSLHHIKFVIILYGTYSFWTTGETTISKNRNQNFLGVVSDNISYSAHLSDTILSNLWCMYLASNWLTFSFPRFVISTIISTHLARWLFLHIQGRTPSTVIVFLWSRTLIFIFLIQLWGLSEKNTLQAKWCSDLMQNNQTAWRERWNHWHIVRVYGKHLTVYRFTVYQFAMKFG